MCAQNQPDVTSADIVAMSMDDQNHAPGYRGQPFASIGLLVNCPLPPCTKSLSTGLRFSHHGKMSEHPEWA